jgi:hypothetical protein
MSENNPERRNSPLYGFLLLRGYVTPTLALRGRLGDISRFSEGF